MIKSLLRLISNLWNYVLRLIGLKRILPPSNKMQVFIKTNEGEQVSLLLEPSSSVQKIKEDMAVKMKTKSEKGFKLIFAGKELPDDLTIDQCDLGNHSVLHAIKITKNQDHSPRINFTGQKLPQVKELIIEKENINTVHGENRPRTGNRVPLLCDPSTVLTIQLSEREQEQLKLLKDSVQSKDRPYFYVYCSSPCKSVRVGKLRVRCRECKQGAIILKKDPSSWNDVLNPEQIECICETTGCNGSFAEFYFKCRDHETSGEDDTAVVLYLVRVNVPDVRCMACLDVASPIIVFQCESEHVACLDCFITYSLSRLNERRFVFDNVLGYTLPCPAACENSLIKETHHFRLIGDAQYDRYQRFGAEEALLAAGGVICPKPDCGQGLLPDEYCRRIQCLGCSFVFCRNCSQGFHLDECRPEEDNEPEYEHFSIDADRAAFSTYNKASRVTIKSLTKPCPKCRTPTERDGGCMHMVCTRPSCQFNWCWVCQNEWTRDCMGAHWFG